jgi:hypothetical protein
MSSLIKSYVNALPNSQTFIQSVGGSFVASLCMGALMSGNPAVGVISGAAGALAATVYILTIPLFKHIFNNSRAGDTWPQFIIRNIVVLTLTSFILAGRLRVDIVYSLILSSLFRWIAIESSRNNQGIQGDQSLIFFVPV